MSGTDLSGTPRRQSLGYYLAFAAALVGCVCLAIAVDGTRRAMQGGDGLNALSGAGVPALIVAWATAFYARLAFSDKLAPGTRLLVHRSLRVLLVVEIVAAVAATWFVVTSSVASAELRGLLFVGDLLQVGTLLWVTRFYRE